MTLNQKFVQKAIEQPELDITCLDLHAESCNLKALMQFKNACKTLWKIYLVVHLIPLVLKRKELKSKPVQTLKRFFVAYLKSMLSVGINSAIIRRLICFFTAYFGFHGHYTIPQGFISGIALMIESPARQAEISLYCAAKSIEMTYNVLKRRNVVNGLPCGQALIFGVAMAILCYYYQNEGGAIRRSYLSGMKNILGPV